MEIVHYPLTLPAAAPGIVRSMLRTGLRPTNEAGAGEPKPAHRPFEWCDGNIDDQSFPVTAANWAKTVVAGTLLSSGSMLPSEALRVLEQHGFRGAEGGETIACALAHPVLGMKDRLLAPGQSLSPKGNSYECIISIGPHNGGRSVYLAPWHLRFPAGTMFLGIQTA